MKQYKDCPPEATIAKIESILAHNNIKVKITKLNNGYFYSCRVDICNNKLKKMEIGTNGKGMNEKYALASGLGELMERLQNGILLSKFDNGSECFRNHLNNYEKHNKPNLHDFYSVMEHHTTKMPIEEIIHKNGSSGMCAGNSAKEAITQGICEIFERFVIKEIYEKKLSLPTIPLDFFKGSELYKRICSLLKQNPNLKIIIKDCSLNCELPVVGVIMIDTENQLYNLHLGSDCNPIVATERCFTELFQNTKYFFGNHYEFTNSPDKTEFLKTTCYNSGSWPISIFNDKSPFSFSQNSLFYSGKIENDLEYCVKVLKKMGCNLYVRDNSFLGFPAYNVYVPEMSVLKRIQPKRDLIDFFNFSRIGILSEKELQEFANNVDNNYLTIKEEDEIIGIRKYFPYNVNCDLLKLDLDLFIALLMYRVKKYDRFVFYMKIYLKDKNEAEYVYFYAAYNFVLLHRVQNENIELVTSVLTKCYGKELAEEVINDMIKPEEILKYYKFPSYPDCSKCKLRKECRVDDIVKICIDLHQKEIIANIDQGRLAEVFDFDI